MNNKNVVLLSTADWDNPFWTNKQHMAVEFARRGYRVLYIDSLGLRRPSLTGRDLRRVLRRIAKAIRPPQKVRENLWVWSPVMLPFNGVPLIRKLNRWLLVGGLAVWTSWLRMRKAVLWTYNPLSSELLNTRSWSRVVYHCVDEIKAQPGMPSAILERAETDLVRKADIVFVTSTTLEADRKKLNEHTYYLPNVADFDHFAKAMSADEEVPGDLAKIASPRIGFIGAISGYKIDFSLLRDVALRHPAWSLVLIGEIGEGDPWTDSAILHDVPNIHFLGPRAYASLPGYLKGMDVTILPNVLNEYTAAMFPMKFFEYLASGRPVVATNLPSLSAYASTAYLARSPEDFAAGISLALSGEITGLEDRLALARANTYHSRMDKMLALVGKIGA